MCSPEFLQKDCVFCSFVDVFFAFTFFFAPCEQLSHTLCVTSPRGHGRCVRALRAPCAALGACQRACCARDACWRVSTQPKGGVRPVSPPSRQGFPRDITRISGLGR